MVDIEYEKLEMHCFHCFSLSHEKKTCPQLVSPAKDASKPLGINQQLTLNRLDEKRRAEQKKDPRPAPGDHRSGYNRGRPVTRHRGTSPRWSPPRCMSPRRLPNLSRDSRHHQSGTGQRFSENSYRGQSQGRNQIDNHGRVSDNHRRDSSFRSSAQQRPRENFDWEDNRLRSSRIDRVDPLPLQDHLSRRSPSRCDASASQRHASSHTPSPKPQREPSGLPPSQASGGGLSSSHNRRPALERLSFGGEAGPSRPRQEVSVDSSKLQDVEIRYEAAAAQANITTTSPLQEVFASPVSGGSRTPVSLRLGPVPAANKRKPPRAKAGTGKAAANPEKISQKASGKRKVPRAPTKPRVARSPLQGTSLRKIHSTRSKNPPKKRLCAESSKSLPCNEEAPGPSATPSSIPAPILSSESVQEVADFQSPRAPLP